MTSNANTCPGCGKAANGNFCQNCGTSLGGRFCDQCGTKADKGARFCNQCGATLGAGEGAAGAPAAAPPRAPAAPARAGGGRRAPAPAPSAAPAAGPSGNLPWWIAGFAMFGLILVIGINMVRPAGPVAPAGGGVPGGNPAAGQSDVDLNSMTPREAADRLFDRVMRTISQGDTAGALAFQPMAVQAYGMIPEIDLDGKIHVALLELLTSPEEATTTVEEILAVEPNHVIALGIAADAAIRMGDEARAEELYRQVARVYDAESARNLVEYDGHRTIMADVKATADAFLAGR